jgi:hypothetical protein
VVGDHGGGVRPHRLLVERVDRGSLRPAAGRADVVGDRVQCGLRAADQMDGRAFPGERPRGGTADRAAAAVDDRVPVSSSIS